MVRITRPKDPPGPKEEPDRLWMVRHARTALNKGGSSVERVRGWQDVPLDREGKAEARKIGQQFEGLPIHLIMASDLARAEATAKEIQRVTGARLVVTPGLRPWNMGDFEGQVYADVLPTLHRYAKESPNEALPGGESFTAFLDRFFDLLDEVLEKLKHLAGGKVIFVTSSRNLMVAQAWLAAGGVGRKINVGVYNGEAPGPGAILEIEPGEKRATGKLLFPGFGGKSSPRQEKRAVRADENHPRAALHGSGR